LAVIERYDPYKFNPALTIEENIVFGEVAPNGSAVGRTLEALLEDAIVELGMIDELRRIGLLFPVGVSGSRLSPSQREKLALARDLMKQTTWLIIDNGVSELDSATQRDVIRGVREHRKDQGLIWSLQDPDLAGDFDQQIELVRT
jgi:putative ABC transport system ATP-binding protein